MLLTVLMLGTGAVLLNALTGPSTSLDTCNTDDCPPHPLQMQLDPPRTQLRRDNSQMGTTVEEVWYHLRDVRAKEAKEHPGFKLVWPTVS